MFTRTTPDKAVGFTHGGLNLMIADAATDDHQRHHHRGRERLSRFSISQLLPAMPLHEHSND